MRRCLALSAVLALATPMAWGDDPAAELRVHEWGVWKVRQGEVTHLADLQRESPTFVRQTRSVGWAGGGAVARKPVIYVYASHPMNLDVEVAFRGGGPWLFYPQALPLECGAGHGDARRDQPFSRAATCEPDRLRWRVHATGAARVPLEPVPARHFWSHLRAVPASMLLAPDGSAERFLFYDGPVVFPPAFRVGRGAHGETTFRRVGAFGRSPLVVAWGDRWVPVPEMAPGAALGIDRTQPWPIPARPIAREIDARLRAAGLSAAEAQSLVETWRPEIEAPGLRAFWLLTRAEYDTLLPIRITPAPSELVRVGLVIESLDPSP